MQHFSCFPSISSSVKINFFSRNFWISSTCFTSHKTVSDYPYRMSRVFCSSKTNNGSTSGSSRLSSQRMPTSLGQVRTKKNPPPAPGAVLSEEETRLAVRKLMLHHFAHAKYRKSIGVNRLSDENESDKKQPTSHELARLERLQQKTRNARFLTSNEVGDHIFLISKHPSPNISDNT